MTSMDSQLFWSAVKSGTINGLVAGAVIELSLRFVHVYQNWLYERTPLPDEMQIQMSPYPFRWWYLPLLSFVLVVPMSLLVQHFMSHHIKSPILLWQIIGLGSVLTLYLSILISDVWNAHFSIMGADYWLFAWSLNLMGWLSLVISVAVFNLLYSLVIQFIRYKLHKQK